MSTIPFGLTQRDVDIIRGLAERKRALAEDPQNQERRRLWYAHDAGKGERPMILTEPQVAFDAYPESQAQCETEMGRSLERGLRFEQFTFDVIRDDHVVEPCHNLNWIVHQTGYGVEVKTEWAERASGNVSSRRWSPPLTDLSTDLSLLKPRTFSVDRDRTLQAKAGYEELFGDILDVRIRGAFWWTTGLTIRAIDLVGMENFMLFMCTDPEGLHALMAFLRDDQLAFMDWLEKEKLLSLNDENDYVGSGSMGYTHRLPQEDFDGEARFCDLWGLGESQETAQVGPDMFDEFVFQYQEPICKRFGLVYYGCCEPVHNRWHILKRLPNLKRVSVSPWCDQEFMAEQLGRDYAFSRKPNPTLISTRDWDEDAIRADLRETLDIARDCNVELIMKDVHTLCDEPQRLARWVELARETIDERAGAAV